jgi:hypothetical protein
VPLSLRWLEEPKAAAPAAPVAPAAPAAPPPEPDLPWVIAAADLPEGPPAARGAPPEPGGGDPPLLAAAAPGPVDAEAESPILPALREGEEP